ncbi:MAG: ribonuclease G [Gammaproteobacteria bacterium]|nr:ribonuclease G [Gammaproteobacteria bacterium]
MSQEILINVTMMETRVALIENGLLQEIFIDRHNKKSHVGDIYCGRVARVIPGMEAAFVDIGLARAAFIHNSDITVLGADGIEVRGEISRPIQQKLYEGQQLVVQVTKDPISTKGARLSTNLALPSRNLVYLPQSSSLGLSQRLEDEDERERLLALLQDILKAEGQPVRGGFIVRTAAEGANTEELREDVLFLNRLWNKVEQRINRKQGIRTVYREVPLYLRTMRDLLSPQIERILVDDQQTYTEIKEFLEDYVAELDPNIELHTDVRPVFDLYGIEDEIIKALSRCVKLKSGGDLIIDQTEAMTTIDVNTGSYLGSRNHAETVLQTNLEAAAAIARQLRVRNLGGIIIVDFIDMLDPEHQRQLYRSFSRLLEKDNARTSITEISSLGLVEMSRKRNRESLGQTLNSPCPFCDGRGKLKSAETVCYEIFREILATAKTYEKDVMLVTASQVVVDRLLDEESDMLAGLEELIGKAVKFEVEPMYSQEQFDLVMT